MTVRPIITGPAPQQTTAEDAVIVPELGFESVDQIITDCSQFQHTDPDKALDYLFHQEVLRSIVRDQESHKNRHNTENSLRLQQLFFEKPLFPALEEKLHSTNCYLDKVLEDLKSSPGKFSEIVSHPLFSALGLSPLPKLLPAPTPSAPVAGNGAQSDFNERASQPALSGKPKWSDKVTRRGRNAAQFIREEYKDELARNLTRAALNLIDPPLGNAYGVWLTRHPNDFVWPGDGTRKRTISKDTPPEVALKHRRKIDAQRQSRLRLRRS